ncbi:glycosyltransferase [Occultella glacieicola]|uniref:Glycosyltransferase n=1 Tax=Occultella glacieicola TaxID=2518684 RepID=A0ABY2E6E8_9MICO|nr:glycosyltransferase [Occultella glacieicola]TDE96155.1 glycosyltransferase [Occultella glacieicola]
MTDVDLRVGDRPARVAVLVYNDAHADSRVLKTAASLHRAGAHVKIFAVARARSGFPATIERLDSGVELERLPEFELARSVPWLAGAYRWVMGRARGLAERGEVVAVEEAIDAPVADGAAPATTESVAATARDADGCGTPPTAFLAQQPLVAPTAAAPLSARAFAAFFDLWLKAYRTVSLTVYWARAVGAVRRWRPDVIHANDGNTLAPAMLAARGTGTRIIYDAHELWRHRNVRKRPVAPHVEHLIERAGIRRAAGVVTVSPSIASWLQRTYGLLHRPVLVRNIPATGDLPSGAGTGRLRELASLPAETKVIAYSGRLTTNRGIEETIDALNLMGPEVHLVLLGYGEPDYVGPLAERARTAGLRDRVHFVGKVPSAEVADALSDADLAVVYVRPTCLSYYYSLPNKLFESIHAGLPIAAANLPDTADVVAEYGVGLVFESDGPEGLAAAMTRVLADPERYRAASRAATTALTWEHEVERLVALYRSVLWGER